MNFNMLIVDRIFKTTVHKITKEEIVDFALQYDPQYMHIDEKKAEKSLFKGIIASGLHTLSISFKLWVELDIFGDSIIAGTEINNIKFSKPVYPGDVLNVYATIVEKKEKKSYGEVIILISTYKNGTDIQVLKAEMTALVAK